WRDRAEADWSGALYPALQKRARSADTEAMSWEQEIRERRAQLEAQHGRPEVHAAIGIGNTLLMVWALRILIGVSIPALLGLVTRSMFEHKLKDATSNPAPITMNASYPNLSLTQSGTSLSQPGTSLTGSGDPLNSNAPVAHNP